MSTIKKIYGLYGDDDILMDGIKSLQDQGITISEVYTPFPVHGLDKLLKLRKTRISDLAFFYGVYGISLASALTWFIMIRDWPQNIGGKPSFTWGQNMPAFVPIMFELTVFCAAHLMSITYLIRNEMAPWKSPKNPDPRTTDDKFLVEIDSDDVDKIKKALVETGVEEITVKNVDNEN